MLHIEPPTIRAHLWRVIWSALWLPMGFCVATRSAPLPVLASLVALGVLVRFALLARQVATIRRQGGPPPIIVTPEHLKLSLGRLSTRSFNLPLGRIRSVAAIGSRSYGRLVISTRWRCFTIPLRCLTDPAELEGFMLALRQAICAGPGGDAQWAGIETRGSRAREIGWRFPWGSLGATAILALAAGAQGLWLPAGQPMPLVYAGANVPGLVWQGEWFRLIAANLLHSTSWHALAEVTLLWLIGAVLERLVGAARMLLVLLASAIVAQAFAAIVGGLLVPQLFTLGLSGGLLGLLGALAVVTWQFGASLPVGVRPGIAIWVVMTAGIVGVCLFCHGIDLAGVVAGGVAGMGLGGVLFWGRDDIRRANTTVTIAWATSMAVWICGIGVGLWQVAAPQSRTTEQAKLVAARARRGENFRRRAESYCLGGRAQPRCVADPAR